MSLASYLQFAFAFGVVLALIALAALAARRLGLGHPPLSGGERRLRINEAVPLDARHKLVLVCRDQVEHLLVLGPNGAALIEAGIVGASSGRDGAGGTRATMGRPMSTFAPIRSGAGQ